MNVCIIIPVYHSTPNNYEMISLKQCAQVLKSYTKYLVCPFGLNISAYQEIFDNLLHIKYFSNPYFNSLRSYNRLLTSLKFFNAFKDYTHILIHHTDAYVFRDELLYWCKQDYDYIGAPIYEYDGTLMPRKYLGVGNGGFSLHKVLSAIQVLQSWKIVYSIHDLNQWYFKYNWKGRLYYLPYYMRTFIGFGRLAHHGFNRLRINEDMFWGIYVPKAFSWYKVAPFDVAYQFSMEYNCEKLYELNQKKLPFGCHQWYKGEFFKFWQDKIEQFSL